MLGKFSTTEFKMKSFNFGLQCYTCTAILCLHSEAEVNSTNVLLSWHCNVDTQLYLSISFTNYVYAPLKSHRHSCKKNSNKLMVSSQFHKPWTELIKGSVHLRGLWHQVVYGSNIS